MSTRDTLPDIQEVPSILYVDDMLDGLADNIPSMCKELLKLRLHGDCDDLFFDKKCRRIYASCGEGFIDVFTQTDADHYALIESVKTAAQARTCFFDGQKIYIAVPKRGEQGAAVRIYETR